MSISAQSYYLDQLDIPLWLERKEPGIAPMESHLPLDADILFILNLKDVFNQELKNFLEAVVFSILQQSSVFAYAFYQPHGTKIPELSLIQRYIDNPSIKIILIEQHNFFREQLPSRPNICYSRVASDCSWNSIKFKKHLMDCLFHAEFLVQ